MAAMFDSRASDYDKSAFHRDLAADVSKLIRPPAGDVLDVGTGTGLALRALTGAAGVTSRTGIDVSAAMLAIAQHHLPDSRLVLAPAEALPFEGATFDTILCVAAVPYLDIARAMGEWGRVLRAGGQVVITAHEADGVRSGSLVRESGRRLGIDLGDPNASTGTAEDIERLARTSQLHIDAIQRRTYTWPHEFDAAGFDLQLRYFPVGKQPTAAEVDAWRSAYLDLAAQFHEEEHRVMLVRLTRALEAT